MRQNKIMLKPRTIEKNYQPQISAKALTEVQNEMAAYGAVVMQSGLSDVSKGIYIDFADKFVRWLAGNFTPGTVKDRYGR